MGAVRQKQQQQIKFIQCANERQSHTRRYKGRDLTYKSVEHLVEDGSQTPPVNCAVVRLLLENLRGQVLHGKRRERVNTSQTIITGGVCVCVCVCGESRDLLCTSGVPQKVVVVPLASTPSLQRPKSVRTMWPCESNRMFSGFRSL